MALLETWRKMAYSETADKNALSKLWGDYFQKEKEIYAELLSNPDTAVTGTAFKTFLPPGVLILLLKP